MSDWVSVILLAGHAGGPDAGFSPLSRVAGLSLLGRLVKNAAFGGASGLVVVVEPGAPELLAEVRAHWPRPDSLRIVEVPAGTGEMDALRLIPEPGSSPWAVQLGDVSYSRNLLQALLQEGLGGKVAVEAVLEAGSGGDDPFHRPHPDGTRFAGLVLLDPARLATLGPAGDLAAALAEAGDAVGRRPLGNSFALHLRGRADLGRAEGLLVRHLRRNTDGIVSRWLNRPVSLFLTRWVFVRSPLSPNAITFLAALVGWAAIALMFAWPGYCWILLGALLFHVSSVLDGCDGEVARLRFQFSRFGEWFDNVLDEVNNAAFIAGIGFGIWRTGGSEIFAWAAGFHVLAVATCDSATFWQLVRWRGGSGSIDKYQWFFQGEKKLQPSDPTAFPPRRSPFEWLQELPRRDFYIFMLLVLAIFDALVVGFWISVGVAVILFVLSVVQWVWQLRVEHARR